MSFELEYDEKKSTIRGSGRDNVGAFVILGLFDEQSIRFAKTYTDGGQMEQWTYIGQRHDAPNSMVFKGGWGTNGKQHGSFVLTGSFFSLTGQWRGNYYYYYDPTVIDAPMDLRLEMEAERVRGTGSDQWGPFTIKGTVQGHQLNVKKTYESRTVWQWSGIVAARDAKISGSWGGARHEGGTFQITKQQQAGEATPRLSAEAALAFLGTEEKLCGGVVEEIATQVGEELGPQVLDTLKTGFTSFV